MKKPRRVYKIIKILLIFFLIIIVLYALFQYVCAPVYDFPQKQKFSGNRIYNPYQNCNSGAWKKAVFHLHSKSWGGIANGAGSDQQIFDRYQYLGYDVVTLSNYQKINHAKYPVQQEYIANYEHGFGIKKNHHINISASSVLAFDFMFPQTLSNKQFIINLLRTRTKVLALAHPDWNGAVSANDIKQLCNYDLLEIQSNYRNSVNLWDTALSAGAAVFLLVDDDGHDINNPNVVGRCLTMVNTNETSQVSVIDALKTGKTIGVAVGSIENESFETKKVNIGQLPVLNYLYLAYDTIKLSVSKKASEIQFIGQQGQVLKTVNNTSKTSYIFKHKDTYVRTQITFADGSVYYLNPLIRYNGKAFAEYQPTLNVVITVLKNAIFIILLIVIIGFNLRRKPKKQG
ncbi:MAG: hypothetical protein WCQ95_07660 [Bacteroidota bacterium]